MKIQKYFSSFPSRLIESIAQDDPKLTEVWDPVPPVVTPGAALSPPGDAIVLLTAKISMGDCRERKSRGLGRNRRNTQPLSPEADRFRTTKRFSDCQLHVRVAFTLRCNGRRTGTRQQRHLPSKAGMKSRCWTATNNPTYSNGQAALL